ncbi:hypothetical protein D9758_009306 [Tetrapyrgos nigripes]|uniref:DUF6535 domain-containing protein n=1 Tax=Tetrapyrgos nigripes TaxID=182062 RepID=A0A8H5LPK2_9AGAR|nr:hypothetical protein D9758_009306 [Tetrapyrgos nigripes]
MAGAFTYIRKFHAVVSVDMPKSSRPYAGFLRSPKSTNPDPESSNPIDIRLDEVDGWTGVKEEDLNVPFKPSADDESCSKLWSIYIDEAQRYDEKLLQGWKEDMAGMLLFSALYSASLTAFIIESYKTLQDDPAQNTVALLKQISQQLASETALPFQPLPSFEPDAASVLCNVLWFLALALALTCSLLATFVQQWARDFLHKTTMRPSPLRRARIIAFMYFGLRDFGMHFFVDLIPILLHVSLLFFFAGLIGFLFPVSRPLTYLMASVLVVFLAVYIIMTWLPLLYQNSPYRTPLSDSLWRLGNALDSLLLRRPTFLRLHDTLTEAMLEKSVQDPIKRDQQAMLYTVKSLNDDHELLPFIEAIPDAIYNPGHAWDPHHGVRIANKELIMPLLRTFDPEANIINRITHFMSKSSHWTTPSFQSRSSQACPLALWSLAFMLIHTPGQLPESSHGKVRVYWFDQRDITAVSHSANPQYVLSAQAAMQLSRLHSMQHCVDVVSEMLLETGRMTQLPQLLLQLSHAQKIWNGIGFESFEYKRFRTFTSLCRKLHSTLKAACASVDPSPQITEAEETIHQLRENVNWRPMQLSVLREYLFQTVHLVASTGSLPYKFTLMCENICPDNQEFLDIDNDDAEHRVQYTGPLYQLQHLLDVGQITLSTTTDAVMAQSMKLFFAPGRALSDTAQAVRGRAIIQRYFCERASNLASDIMISSGPDDSNSISTNVFGLGPEDLSRIGTCILKDLKTPSFHSNPNLCLQSTWLLLLQSGFSVKQEQNFPLEVFFILRQAPPSLQQDSMYSLVQSLVDAIASDRIVYHKIDDVENTLRREYLYQELLVFYPSSKSHSHRTTILLNFAIMTRFIGLCCTRRPPSRYLEAFRIIMAPLRQVQKLDIDERNQTIFAENVLRLVQTITDLDGSKDNDNDRHTEYNQLIEILRCTWEDISAVNWDWVTSWRCAKILREAAGLIERFGRMRGRLGKQDVLLSRCQMVLYTRKTQKECRAWKKKRRFTQSLPLIRGEIPLAKSRRRRLRTKRGPKFGKALVQST